MGFCISFHANNVNVPGKLTSTNHVTKSEKQPLPKYKKWVKRMSTSYIKKNLASPGNRTRVARMGILHDTTTPATQLSTIMMKKFWVTKVSARLAQSVEHETLNLRVVGSSPTLGVHFFLLIYFDIDLLQFICYINAPK